MHDETLAVLRPDPSPGVIVDGKIMTLGKKRIEIQGNVQPVTGRDLLIVPEGDRSKEQFSIYSAFAFALNDEVLRNGFVYQVQSVEEWGSYYKARIMREDVGANAYSTSN